MFNFLNLFKKSDDLNTKINYKKASDLGKSTDFTVIPTIEIPQNEKPNIVILDDNEQAGNVTVLDITMLGVIAEKLRKDGISSLNNNQQHFVESLPNRLITKLNNLNTQDYNIISITGLMSAFTLFEAIDRGLKVDYAILDILIGGQNKYNGKSIILDGIDVANKIIETNPKAKYYFYSGCSLVDESDESIKYRNIFNSNIKDKVITKDKDFNNKRQKILELVT